ncbi:7722_t:CDS:2, partial [Dentiscutata erythropus]
SCWFRDSGQKYNIIWQWITLFGWVVMSIIYCTIVVIMVIGKLKSATKKPDNFDSSHLSDYPTLINKALISSVVRRVMWYPVVPLVVQFFNSFVETFAYVHSEIPYILLLLCDIGLSLQGLLNALVFSQDVAVTRAFEDVKLHWWITNVNTYEVHYPHRSHNKAITDEFNMIGELNDFVELNSLNRNKTDVITRDIINDDINNDFTNNNIINNITNNNIIKKDITNNNIIINNVINNNFINNNFINNYKNIPTNYRVINNNNLVLQPSLLEWLRYMLLIKLFSAPKISSYLISPKLLSQIDSFSGNMPNTLSAVSGKDDSKQDITLDNQNDNQNIHLVFPEPTLLKDSSQSSPLALSSNRLNSSSLFDPLIGNRSNCTVGDDEGQTNIMLINGESTDLSQENENIKLMLKRVGIIVQVPKNISPERSQSFSVYNIGPDLFYHVDDKYFVHKGSYIFYFYTDPPGKNRENYRKFIAITPEFKMDTATN